MMAYTEEQLYGFMDARKIVRVTSITGKVYTGMCLAYSSACNQDDFGVDEPSLEVQDTVLYLHEIQRIEFVD